MGIKGLWTVLSPYGEKKALYEIRGETVAVDLSGWICDSQNVTDSYMQPKLYLRNLFFRTAYLLLADINPIFVLEGDAPELKRHVMACRNALNFQGLMLKDKESTTRKKPAVARKRFKNVLFECESLLKSMGVRCIKGHGEAEATCAQLNAQGLADAVISQDSDCFAYGARRVYKNFSVSSASGGGALQGSVECYDAQEIYHKNGFGRNKMVALALLCGSDYGTGACGSSVNTVTSFLHTVSDAEVLQRLSSWVDDTEEYSRLSRWAGAAGRCGRCGHAGRSHGRSGCSACGTSRSCEDTGYKSKLAQVKTELSLRQRALSSGMPFPDQEIIKEFLDSKSFSGDDGILKHPMPSLIQFIKIMTSKLDWSERYCVEKFLPVLTKSHLQSTVICRTIKPVKINKKRKPRGVPSYEVVWTDLNGLYEDLIPDDQFDEGEDISTAWTTVECQELMQIYYPQIVDVYEESIKKPPKTKKHRSKKCDKDLKTKKKKISINKMIQSKEIENISSSIQKLNLSCKNSSGLNVSVSVKSLKRKYKTKQQKKIDSYIVNKRRKTNKSKSFNNISMRSGFLKSSPVCLPKIKDNIGQLEVLDMSENYEDIELSHIVENIVNSAPNWRTAEIGNGNIVKLMFDNNNYNKFVLDKIVNQSSTPNGSPVSKNNVKIDARSTKNFRTSSFFDKFNDEPDAFEISLQCEKSVIICTDLDDEKTLNYSLPDVCL